MGTILERKRKDGSIAYMAQIMLMRERKIVHRESRTFDRRPAAAAWIKKREKELEKPGALLGMHSNTRNPTLSDAIDRYIAESSRAMGRTKMQVLAAVKSYDIADIRCADIQSPDIVAFAQTLAKGVQPQTVANYLSHLAAIFSIARPAWGYESDQSAIADALKVAKRLGLTSKSKARERRPTLEEMHRLMLHFEERHKRRPSSNPMHVLVAFAVFSTPQDLRDNPYRMGRSRSGG